MGGLVLEFCGEELTLGTEESLTFGRDADLVIDDNPYLHRVLGRFVNRDGTWWIDNVGRAVGLTISEPSGANSATVGPRSSTALVHGEFSCSSSLARPVSIDGLLEDHEREVDLLGIDPTEGSETLEWGVVDLNPDQRLLLVAMCEHRLREPAERDAVSPPTGPALSGWAGASRSSTASSTTCASNWPVTESPASTVIWECWRPTAGSDWSTTP